MKMYLTIVQTERRQQTSRLNEGIDVLKSELDILTKSMHFILGPFLQNLSDGSY